MEIQHLKLKKQYKSKSTLIQFLILFHLEKRDKLTISQIADSIGYKEDQVANEATFLLYHPSFNPKKIKTSGLILTDSADSGDLNPNHSIWVNKDFFLVSLIVNTIPTKQRKVCKYNYA